MAVAQAPAVRRQARARAMGHSPRDFQNLDTNSGGLNCKTTTPLCLSCLHARETTATTQILIFFAISTFLCETSVKKPNPRNATHTHLQPRAQPLEDTHPHACFRMDRTHNPIYRIYTTRIDTHKEGVWLHMSKQVTVWPLGLMPLGIAV